MFFYLLQFADPTNNVGINIPYIQSIILMLLPSVILPV